jgi:hypothetical protein
VKCKIPKSKIERIQTCPLLDRSQMVLVEKRKPLSAHVGHEIARSEN